MSRYIDTVDGEDKITIASMEECRHLYNEVCTEPRCDECCDFPAPELCAKCKWFEKEDGVI